jgi:hypothetical protein
MFSLVGAWWQHRPGRRTGQRWACYSRLLIGHVDRLVRIKQAPAAEPTDRYQDSETRVSRCIWVRPNSGCLTAPLQVKNLPGRQPDHRCRLLVAGPRGGDGRQSVVIEQVERPLMPRRAHRHALGRGTPVGHRRCIAGRADHSLGVTGRRGLPQPLPAADVHGPGAAGAGRPAGRLSLPRGRSGRRQELGRLPKLPYLQFTAT